MAKLYQATLTQPERQDLHSDDSRGQGRRVGGLGAFERDLPERVGDRPPMAAHVSAWEQRRNGARVKADRQFTTADARA